MLLKSTTVPNRLATESFPRFLCRVVVGVCSCAALVAEEPAGAAPRDLTLADLRQLVVNRNEGLQMKLLEAEIGKRTLRAEKGIFEPRLVTTYDHIDSQRPNNQQQMISLFASGSPAETDERNSIYDTGIEFLTPVGTKLKTGYTLRDLKNNLQKGGKDYETFLGTSLVQPLLKGFGTGPTLARIRLAALASDIAFQEYRRQLMLSVAQAEAAYWDLYLMQEQDRISRESVTTADKILTDNKARRDVGKSSDLEVLQAEAGVSLRKTRLNEARQKVYEGGSKLSSLYSNMPGNNEAFPRATEVPQVVEDGSTLSGSYELAASNNPDYLIRQKQAEQEGVRVSYLKNQRLPQLDFKSTYGFNGLGGTPGSSWDMVTRAETVAWSVGAELHIPLGGGVKERNEYEASKLTQRKSAVALKEAQVQIFNAIDSALQKLKLYRDNVGSYAMVVQFHQKLLEAQLDRLAVGSIDSKTVLETEEKLFAAKISAVESQVLYRKALLDVELVRGSILGAREIEVTPQTLKRRTDDYLKTAKVSPAAVEAFKKQAAADVEKAVAAGR